MSSSQNAKPNNKTILSKKQVLRRSFATCKGIDVGQLTSIQTESYTDFLQANIDHKDRKDIGLQKIFNKIFPIWNHNKQMVLEFIGYKLLEPRDDIEECKRTDLTYAAPLQAKFKRLVYQTDEQTKEKRIIDVCEQEVFLGSIPLMTPQATFVISGVERVLVSQLHRAPGVFFEYDIGKNNTGRYTYTAKVIPGAGSWIEFEYGGARNECYVKIDKKRKISAVTLLMCLDSKHYQSKEYIDAKTTTDLASIARTGMTKGELLALAYGTNRAKRVEDGWLINFIPDEWIGVELTNDLIDGKTREVIATEGTRINNKILNGLSNTKTLFLQDLEFLSHYTADDIVDLDSGAILVQAGEELTYETVKNLLESGLDEIEFLSMNRKMSDVHWRDNVYNDSIKTREEALSALYRLFRPGEHPSINASYDLFHNLFFNSEKYDITEVGRVRLNNSLGIEISENKTVLTKDDLVGIVKKLLLVKAEKAKVDDPDSLINKRIRSAGELLESQCMAAMLKMKRLIKDKMSLSDISQTTPHSLFNAQLFMSAIREFFTRSQLSQFMEHTNPISALTHVRKVSSLGPGGMQRGSAVIDVRDAHSSAYGKLCPIQTPEGANIGLIHSLAVNAKVDKYGFLQAMYRKVINGVITDEIVYLSAFEETKYNIAYGDSARNEKNELVGPLVPCRQSDETVFIPLDKVDFIESSTNHIVSVSASLIPGLSNNDATRDLMGANMQGQAVPLLYPQAPIVGTGMEASVLLSTQTCVYAKRSGVVMQVQSNRIVIKADELNEKDGLLDIYKLKKYQQSNAGTCLNQTPLVQVGDLVHKGQILADGQSSSKGELALGANVRVAFLSQAGNFEDSMILSQRLVKDNVFSSIHVQIFEVVARETKIGSQEITRDIPGVDLEKLWHLDESGIIQRGTVVKPGMILVGRLTPKLDTPITGEDKLVRAIFKSAASTVKDDSLYVPAGVHGTVIDVKMFSRKSGAASERALAMQKMELMNLTQDRDIELEALRGSFSKIWKELIEEQTLLSELMVMDSNKKSQLIPAGTVIKNASVILSATNEVLDLNIANSINLKVKDKKRQAEIDAFVAKYEEACKVIQDKFLNAADKVQAGVELQPGVLKVVKIYVAVKRDVQVGDKLAGRHGNKGIVSYVLPESQMPYTADGKPVDMVLTPLGVVSRMNLGQILEIHLGNAAEGLTEKLKAMLIGYSHARLGVNPYQQEDIVVSEQQDPTEENPNGIPYVHYSSIPNKIYPNMELSQIKDFVKSIYEDHKAEIDELDDDEFLQLALKIAREGVHFASPVFDGATNKHVEDLLKLGDCSEDGKEVLYDGKTGLPFDSKVTVGNMYMLKLHHLVADKIHARSTGPYSSVTLQPLGGKAQDGGQRDGEMENWAFQAYGSASILLEMMTIKSDSVDGRAEAYKSITSGMSPNFLSTPAVFSVFVKELEALGLKVDCVPREHPLKDGWRRDKDIDKIAIRLKSPEEILAQSYGCVTRPETINYRTSKPEPDGLCCQKIFGPVADYRCACGKYQKMRDRGKVCEKCGVEVTVSWVRRERMGHIELPAPVLHPWFYRILPSKICLMLDMNFTDVDSVLNMDKYIVIDPGMTMLAKKQLLTEHEYYQAVHMYGGEAFIAMMGAEAIHELLRQMNLDKEATKLRASLSETTVAMKRKKLVNRLKLVEGFRDAKIRPEWMVMTVIPVLPADLRPLVPIEGGRFASSDLNELYRRLVNRVKRLERLISLKAPEILIRSEKRLLQEAVDNLFDNGRRERPVLGSHKRPLRSLSDGLKGKQGIFRQHLLGKRVDYSGRSVIAVDAEDLKLHQCGLPKIMALELFKPFVYARLLKDGMALTLKDAKIMVDEERPEVWDALKDVIYKHPVLLNRAPTLHRLSMRAFEPVLIDGKAIRLHPLACSAFNADFDGDQMAVHVPLSHIAQLEARVLMSAAVNQLKPSDGRSAILPSKDMVLGLFYLTNQAVGGESNQHYYSLSELVDAYKSGAIKLHNSVRVWHDGAFIHTTPGRAILFSILPKHPAVKFDLVNKTFVSKDVATLFSFLYQECGQRYTGEFADAVMRLGFEYAAKSGTSFSLFDLRIPAAKSTLIEQTEKLTAKLRDQYMEGLITDDERYNKVQDLWIKCIDKLSEEIIKEMSAPDERGLINPIYSMILSGARGTKQQLMYMVGMRGLVVKPNGEILESPVEECYASGLKVSSFVSTIASTRKGLGDVALRTAVAGYLTRRLVDAAQDVVVKEHDCGTSEYIEKIALMDGETVVAKLGDRVIGRVLAEDIIDPVTEQILVPANTLLNSKHMDIIDKQQIYSIKVRSVLTCQAKDGVCAMCYGLDLGRNNLVTPWTAIGVIAAQSISEPGTQLTMRSFHSGGGAKKEITDAFVDAPEACTVRFINHRLIKRKDGVDVVVCKGMECILLDLKHSKEFARYELPYGAAVLVKDGDKLEAGQRLAEWEPYVIPILTESVGIVKYVDLIEGVSLQNDVSSIGVSTGISSTVLDWKKHGKKDMKPCIQLITEDGAPILTEYGAELRYTFNVGTNILVQNGQKVYPGDLIAKFSMGQLRSSDITGGLPMISQLFEASRPKKCAILSEIDGVIRFTKDYRGHRRLIVEPLYADRDVPREHVISHGSHLLVQEGHNVKKGDLLVDGSIYAFDVLRILGVKAMIEFFIQAVQDVYRAQGISVNEKHIEVVLKPMLSTVEITDPGDSIYLIGERVNKNEVEEVNEELKLQGKALVYSLPYLQGISDRSLNKSSLASAAFQDSIKYMATAACKGVEEYVSRNVKTAMMTGNYPEQGTGGYLHQLHKEMEAILKNEEEERKLVEETSVVEFLPEQEESGLLSE